MQKGKRAPRFVVALAPAALCLSLAARAAMTYSADATDLWWNASESGWGVNVVQQGDIAFITLFVYGADNLPTWLVGSALKASKDAATVTYSGDLFATTGPSFSSPAFDPDAVTRTKVGRVLFEVDNATDGVLTYTVNGARIVKNVTRQTWRENDPGGSYIGYLTGSCATTVNGPEESMSASITQVPGSFSMSTTGVSGVSCGYIGTYVQAGHLGHSEGALNCTNGKSGSFSLDGLEAGPDGFTGHVTTTVGTCTITTRLAAVRRNGS